MELISIINQINEDSSGLNEKKFFRLILIFEISTVLLFTLFPLFFNLPYRINLFLSWEGAYRIYIGQMPFKDFGMPLGFGYFIIPTIFFHLFGPAMRTLLYAQVFINLFSIFIFRGILKETGVGPANRLLSVLVFTISYTFVFFWPWYNSTAFLYQLIGIYFLLLAYNGTSTKNYLFIIVSAIFTFLSFFTKQDYGGLALIFAIVIIGYQSYINKDFKIALAFAMTYAIFAMICIIPFLQHDFLYWFNYGQAPHDSRLNISDFLKEGLGGSHWEKFYLFMIFILSLDYFKNFKILIKNRKITILLLLSFGMITEALITKVTSRNSLETTTFYHGFACAYVFSKLGLKSYLNNIYSVGIAMLLLILWWSGMYWNYANRMFHIVSENTAKEKKADAPKAEKWVAASIPVFNGVNLPESTIKGIERLKSLKVIKEKNTDLKVLNMSELTALAHELPYTPQSNLPLWYHLNIGMFDKQAKEISSQIKNNEYDLVLFEVIPSLENFYPETIRVELNKYYHKTDEFAAPRKEGDSFVEVYIRK